jgi:hypothetical protein
MSTLDLRVLLHILSENQTIPSEYKASYQTVARLLAGNIGKYTPESKGVEFRTSPLSYQALYQDLTYAVDTLDLKSDVLGILRCIFFDFENLSVYANLKTIDHASFKAVLKSAITSIKQATDNNPNYILILKAVFSLKFLLEYTKLGRPVKLNAPDTLEEALRDFNDLLHTPAMRLEPLEVLSDFTVPKTSMPVRVQPPSQGLSRFATQRKSRGRQACDYFMESKRQVCSFRGHQSFFEVTQSALIAKRFLSSLHTQKRTYWVSALARRYLPTDYRPMFVKDFIYTLEEKGLLIDSYFNPTGGWSGRLVGAMSVPSIKHYQETDPNISLFENKIRIIHSYNPLETKQAIVSSLDGEVIGVQSADKNYIIRQKPIEDLTEAEIRPNGQSYSLVLYSPPYFNLESYAGEKQSHTRYTHLEPWVRGFLVKSIEQSYIALKYGGVFAMSIADTAKYKLVDKFMQFMHMEQNNKFASIAIYNYGGNTTYTSSVYVYQKCYKLAPSVMRVDMEQSPSSSGILPHERDDLAENYDGSYCVKRPRLTASNLSVFSKASRAEISEKHLSVFDLIRCAGIDA